MGRRDGGERWEGEREGERWREGEGSYITAQRGVRGTRENVCVCGGCKQKEPHTF